MSPLPREVDLRAPWWTVGDQGETGACVGWATADGALRWHLVKAGKLRRDEPLSPRFTWMASKETDSDTKRPETFIEKAGTSLKAALDVCRRFGAVRDSLLPFHVRDLMFTGDAENFYAAAAQRKLASYFNLGRNPRTWRTWLASHGPIVAAIGVDGSWGQMIDQARNELAREPVIWWNITAAGVALFALLLAVNLLGDALRDVLDPRTARERE